MPTRLCCENDVPSCGENAKQTNEKKKRTKTKKNKNTHADTDRKQEENVRHKKPKTKCGRQWVPIPKVQVKSKYGIPTLSVEHVAKLVRRPRNLYSPLGLEPQLQLLVPQVCRNRKKQKTKKQKRLPLDYTIDWKRLIQVLVVLVKQSIHGN